MQATLREKLYFFSKCSQKIVFPKKIKLQYDLPFIIKKDDSFPENLILFLRRKIKDDLSRKIHGNMISSVYAVKMVFLFITNMILPFCQKSKDDLVLKKYT